MNLLLEALPPLIEIWDKSPEPPVDAWTKSTVYAQWTSVVVTFLAFAAAGLAYRMQSKEVKHILMEAAKNTNRQRIAASPLLKIDVEISQEINAALCVGGHKIAGKDFLLNDKFIQQVTAGLANPSDTYKLRILLQNKRAKNKALFMSVKVLNPPLGLTAPTIWDIESLDVARIGIRNDADWWVLSYTIPYGLGRKAPEIDFVLIFETEDGHQDSHIYRHTLGHSVWKRIDPPSI